MLAYAGPVPTLAYVIEWLYLERNDFFIELTEHEKCRASDKDAIKEWDRNDI